MKTHSAKSIHITGLVQGVGFRPFVYRLALSNNINGWVENGNDGVRIHAEGTGIDLDSFIASLSSEAPAASQILEVLVHPSEIHPHHIFEIRKSSDYSDEVTEISPDIAVCDNCLADMKSQPLRINYPFINCTNCGPRFSIIRALPYDRINTTMAPFIMCPACHSEYTDVLDRRFHAQPVACNHCGPHYELIHNGQSYSGTENILDKASQLIMAGSILALKGTGGFHLACNALDEKAVSLLRHRKNREGKPFAVMFKSLEYAKDYLDISQKEEIALASWRRPVVILKNRQNEFHLADSVSNGFDTTGAMLPYIPFHYLLFERLNIPALVLTSGNLSEEPVIIDDKEALARLGNCADAHLIYNREIYNRNDDSVMMFAGGSGRLIRRSRGYAPSPVNLKLNVDGIFAAGAELVNCFCVGKDRKAIMSQHIGDLKNLETLDFYEESLDRFRSVFRVKPSLAVCDLHPDYLSTRFTENFAALNGNIPIVRVQHHHAHIAACLAEYGLDEKVIGISMDGVGFGTDGHTWGFEAMLCDLEGFERKLHLDYVKQPGGDRATLEPWRMALSYLYKYSDGDIERMELPFLKEIGADLVHLIMTALENNINTPLTSSAGRLFDTVAAITGICLRSSFHAEAPMRLENIADSSETGSYSFGLSDVIDPGPVIREIVMDIKDGVPAGKISAKFHRSVVNVIAKTAEILREQSGISKVVLAGGTFQNRILISGTENILKLRQFDVYSPQSFPTNDGGLALGQLVIAAKRRATDNPT